MACGGAEVVERLVFKGVKVLNVCVDKKLSKGQDYDEERDFVDCRRNPMCLANHPCSQHALLW